MYTYLSVGLLLVFKISIVPASSYFVRLTNDSPTVRGGTVHFVAKLYDSDGNPASGSFRYEWIDSSSGDHKARHDSQLPSDTWNVTYPATDYFPPGPYEVQVSVYRCILLICYPSTSQRVTFELTETLNGAMELTQKESHVKGRFISNSDTVIHKVVLNSSDAEYINNVVPASSYFVRLTNDSPTVRGGTVHFVAKLYDSDGNPASGSFRYEWIDSSSGNHEARHDSQLPTDTWNVTYPATDYFPPGAYEVQVSVYRCILLICYPITSQRMTFELTETLNGAMGLTQKGSPVKGRIISNSDTVIHKVVLNASDAEYINTNATSVSNHCKHIFCPKLSRGVQ